MVFLKNLVFVIWLAVVIDGCSQGHDIDGDYTAAKKLFESKFIGHFPKALPEVSTFSISEDKVISHPGIWVKSKFEKEVLDSIQREVDAIAIAKYKSSDTCLMLIDKHLNKTNWLSFEKEQRKYPEVVAAYSNCTNGKMPIPKFWREGWSETIVNPVNLSSDYNLYVLDAKSGRFWDAAKLPNGKFTPEGWGHGYSKGVAINLSTSTIIFWFDIW